MKKHLLPLLLLAMPSHAIAIEPITHPVNFIEWRGKTYNLDHLWGKGVIPVIVQPTPHPVAKKKLRKVRDNRQRVNFLNARNLILIEQLRNMR